MQPDEWDAKARDDMRGRKVSAADIAEGDRCCWKIGCKRTSRLEHFGWRYCLRHYWTQVIRDKEGWRRKLFALRWTRVARHWR